MAQCIFLYRRLTHRPVSSPFHASQTCEEWSYEDGKCPSIKDGVTYFSDEDDCMQNCARSHSVQPPGCEAPSLGVPCRVSAMIEPYFAFNHTGGIWRCHQADINTIREHRCLEEKRRFNTEADCISTCGRGHAEEKTTTAIAPRKPSPREMCHRVKSPFTFCEKSNVGYYYDGHEHKCFSTHDKEHYVCYHGPNQFDTEEDCRRDCVTGTKRALRCGNARDLLPCEEKHLKNSWWFYSPTLQKCNEWPYQDGKCPATTDGVRYFISEDACVQNCARRGSEKPAGCYAPPTGAACPVSAMKKPYFAFKHSDGTWRCYRADINTISSHRCLEEKRRFVTEDACRTTCDRGYVPQKATTKASKIDIIVTEFKRRQMCHRVKSYFRFCDKGNMGYYFDGHKMRCLSVTEEEHFVCNTGPNRFATEEECLRTCVRPSQKADLCLITRELIPCEAQHLSVTWWFFDFGLYSCTRWTYNNGRCPGIGQGVNYFTTFDECIAACAPGGHNKPAPCYAPSFGHTCPASLMKEPYFAHRYLDGTWRCHKADINTIREHRCVEEKRRFDTEEACKSTCERNPRRELQALPPSIQPLTGTVNDAIRRLNLIGAVREQ